MVAPIYDWTGFYIGGNGGRGQSRNCFDFVDAFGVFVADGCRERSGGLVGGVRYSAQAVARRREIRTLIRFARSLSSGSTLGGILSRNSATRERWRCFHYARNGRPLLLFNRLESS
jgi:hypothetical protein